MDIGAIFFFVGGGGEGGVNGAKCELEKNRCTILNL
jgi:hypothetical protein